MILFVGDIDDSVRNRAVEYDSSAFLIDSSNVDHVMKSGMVDLVAYTSFADLPKITETRNVFFELLDLATEIYYVRPARWSDHKDEFDHWSNQRITEYFLSKIDQKKKNIHGLELSSWKNNQYLSLADQRCGDVRQLWVSGCSIAHGAGVESQEKFGSLLAEKLNLPASFLTKGGSGIPWAADQILRSDMRSGDIFVWGITSEYRFCVWDKELHHYNPHSFHASQNRSIGTNLENMIYRAVTSIHQVINFCQKSNVRLILLPIIPSETIRLLFRDCPDWYDPGYQIGFVDYGTDKIHPGPKQHSLWADFCYDIIMKDRS